MVTEYEMRPEADVRIEQKYLEGRMEDIEKGLGIVAARLATPTPITEPLDALDRARELVGGFHRQVRVRTLEAAIEAQLDWLERAEARQGREDGEPKTSLTRIALDRRLLVDLLEGWKAAGG